MTEQYFFTCSIGPVQGFVATARTSQDLWFGSWMLSELAKAAAKVLRDGRHALIFPAPESPSDLEPGSSVNVANKVVAIINDAPQAVAAQVWDATAKRLDELAKDSLDSFEAVQLDFDRAGAQMQLNDLIEFFWAASPYNGNNYTQARQRTEALFNARKNTRDFRQMHGKVGLPKSSLDGFRESMLLDAGELEDATGNLKIEKGESLSGIDLVKRWGKRQGDVHFVSTTDLAVLPFEKGIGKPTYDALLVELRALRGQYRGKKDTDGTHFYEDRVVQLLPDKDRTTDFRREFATVFEKHRVKYRPSPYYALLQADGDYMGKTIDSLDSQQQHSALSRALGKCAGQARETIKRYGGIPVYVGGDDILAYLPLHTALECVKTLDGEFSNAMKEFGAGGISPTLSVGLAIAHHLTPLSQVLEQVRNAEKIAKKVEGKNGLAISLGKRGSAERVVKGTLKDPAGRKDLAGRMEQLIGMALQKAISHGAAYELEDLSRRLSIPDVAPETSSAMLHKEAIRILGRKRESGGDEKVNKETKEKVKTWLEGGMMTLDELAREMIIAGELADAYAMAHISPKEVSG